MINGQAKQRRVWAKNHVGTRVESGDKFRSGESKTMRMCADTHGRK